MSNYKEFNLKKYIAIGNLWLGSHDVEGLENSDLQELRKKLISHRRLNIEKISNKINGNNYKPYDKDTEKKAHEVSSIDQLLGLFSYSAQENKNCFFKQRKNTKNLPNIHILIDVLVSEKVQIEKKSKAINVVNKIIDFGNQIGVWDYNFVGIITNRHRQKNPYGTNKDWQELLFSEEFFIAHKNFIQNSKTNKILGQSILGMIAIDLMYESFITKPSFLQQVITLLSDESNYNFQNGRLFFYVKEDVFNVSRRVFIAPQSEILIYLHYSNLNMKELLKKIPTISKGEQFELDFELNEPSPLITDYIDLYIKDTVIVKSIVSYISQLNLPKSLLPSTLTSWCGFAALFHHEILPPVMLQYCTGKKGSFGLTERTLSKLFKCDLSEKKQLTAYSNHHAEITIGSISNYKEINLSYGLHKISQVFNHKSRKQDPVKVLDKITKSYNDLVDLPANSNLLLEWGISLLKIDIFNGKKRFAISPAKISAKISSFARHFIAVLGSDEITLISAEDKANYYADMIDRSISSRNSNTIRANLRNFNYWLEKKHLVPTLEDKEDVFGDPKLTDNTVNSNLITFDEYQAVFVHLEELIQTEQEPELRKYEMMQLSLILGFRCGLRSSEVLRLKLFDFIDCDITPILIIRETKDRELKSINSTRQFNLIEFLTDTEIQLLRKQFIKSKKTFEQLDSRMQSAKKEDIYFFPSNNNPLVAVNKQSIRTPLTAMLKTVCKDKTITFHHLRHSFASWHFLSACIAEWDLKTQDLFKLFPLTNAWLNQADDRKKLHIPTSQKSKKYGFWITTKLGHDGFYMSSKHYIHTMDLVMLLWQEKASSRQISKYWSDLTGIDASYLRKKKFIGIKYATKYHAPKNIESKYKKQEKSFLNSEQFTPVNISKTEKIDYQKNQWLNPILVYQETKEKDFKKLLTKEERKVNSLFKRNPKYRIKPLKEQEILKFNQLINKVERVFNIDLNDKGNYPRTFIQIIRAFSTTISKIKLDKKELKPQERYQLLSTDVKKLKIIISTLNKLDYKYDIYLKLKKTNGKKEGVHNNKCNKYWKKELGVKKKDLLIQDNFQKSQGKNGAIEIRPLRNISNRKNATIRDNALVYFWVSLAVYIDFKP